MTSSIQSLPPEVLHNILINMEEPDIIKYCSTHKLAYTICNDDYFWLQKLDREFSILYNQKYVFASYYANLYAIGENRHDTYFRWKNYDMMNAINSTDRDADIIMFKIDQARNLQDIETINLASYAIRTQNFELLDFMKQQKYTIMYDVVNINDTDIDFDDIMNDMAYKNYITIPILEWLFRNNYDCNMASIFILNDRLDLLKWLNANSPTDITIYNINDAIREGNINVINWMLELGIKPTIILLI